MNLLNLRHKEGLGIVDILKDFHKCLQIFEEESQDGEPIHDVTNNNYVMFFFLKILFMK